MQLGKLCKLQCKIQGFVGEGGQFTGVPSRLKFEPQSKPSSSFLTLRTIRICPFSIFHVSTPKSAKVHSLALFFLIDSTRSTHSNHTSIGHQIIQFSSIAPCFLHIFLIVCVTNTNELVTGKPANAQRVAFSRLNPKSSCRYPVFARSPFQPCQSSSKPPGIKTRSRFRTFSL